MKTLISMALSLFFLASCSTRSSGETALVGASFDRWMYPFNATNGTRVSGSSFGAINNPSFDDHDAQILIGFDTSAGGIPAGRPGSDYEVLAASVKLSTSTDGAFQYDPTYDAFETYLDESLDEDAGRPVEVYGVGTRVGYRVLGFGDGNAGPPIFQETESFGVPGPPSPSTRYAFMSDYDGGAPRDVSNNVRNGFDATPFAVGAVPGLNPGDPVPIDTELVFDLDLTNSNVLNYVQDGLGTGGLFLALGSMHSSEVGSSEGIPSFHLADGSGISLGAIAELEIDYQLVPEPSSFGLVVVAASLLVLRRRTK